MYKMPDQLKLQTTILEFLIRTFDEMGYPIKEEGSETPPLIDSHKE